jgi:hypothetical protein
LHIHGPRDKDIYRSQNEGGGEKSGDSIHKGAQAVAGVVKDVGIGRAIAVFLCGADTLTRHVNNEKLEEKDKKML